jgi:hypothetical protein
MLLKQLGRKPHGVGAGVLFVMEIWARNFDADEVVCFDHVERRG